MFDVVVAPIVAARWRTHSRSYVVIIVPTGVQFVRREACDPAPAVSDRRSFFGDYDRERVRTVEKASVV